MALTPKQQRFVAEYAVDMNGTQAAIRAGYSENRAAITGSELLRQPEIREALTEVQGKVVRKVSELVEASIAEPAVASAAWIVAKAVEVVDAGLAASPVRDREGKVIMVETEGGEMVPAGWDAFNLAAANGALNLLAKRHMEFSDKSDSRVLNMNVPLPEGTTLEDLRALRDGLNANG